MSPVFFFLQSIRMEKQEKPDLYLALLSVIFQDVCQLKEKTITISQWLTRIQSTAGADNLPRAGIYSWNFMHTFTQMKKGQVDSRAMQHWWETIIEAIVQSYLVSETGKRESEREGRAIWLMLEFKLWHQHRNMNAATALTVLTEYREHESKSNLKFTHCSKEFVYVALCKLGLWQSRTRTRNSPLMFLVII